MSNTKQKELVRPMNGGFIKRIITKPAAESEGVYLFMCEECGGYHFRHAGYIKTMIPFMRSGGEKRVNVESVQVMVCVKCKSSYAWINEQMYNLSDKIDIEAWSKAEAELNKATGPGGEC